MAVLMIKQHVTTALFTMFLIFSLEHLVVNSEPTQDKQALLAFLSQIPHENRLQWNPSDSACSWVGVECDSTNSSVYSLRLPGVGFIGPIPANTLGRLSQLRILSLRSNRLSGPIPPDFSNLTLLRSAYFQSNEFSGEFPASLTELTRLTRLDISFNNFSGPIPFSVSNLTHLVGLFLQNNGFSGGIPSISLPSLVQFNVSNNHLNGSIPAALSRFPATAFANNLELCGAPLPPCNPYPPTLPPPTPNPNHRRNNPSLSTSAIIGISIAGGIIILLLLLALIFFLIRRKRSKTTKSHKPPPIIASRSVADPGTSSSKDDIPGGSAAERTKLVFFGGGYSFDLEDLLRASAEVLGKGGLGSSYKAVLEEGTTVVVKRLKDVTATKKEFEKEMEVLGNVKLHHNVLPWRAFFYSKDEKLLVSDYLNAGSLSALLHGSRGSGRTPLDWENRLQIAISAARGLMHLHESKIFHGNIKSSNILLKQENTDSCFSDFGLNSLFSNTAPTNHRIMGYRAPEVIQTRKVTFKSDVYSFGVLLLELLTGKSPNQASLGEEGIDLPRWVQSVVREEWTAEVFDVELMRYHNTEEEMVQLLQIGMACVSVAPDQRPDMHEVLKMIEEMNKGDSTDDGIRISSDDALRGGSVSLTPP